MLSYELGTFFATPSHWNKLVGETEQSRAPAVRRLHRWRKTDVLLMVLGSQIDSGMVLSEKARNLAEKCRIFDQVRMIIICKI